MTKLVETKMVEQTNIKFIADDGREFATETECKNYERTQNEEKVLKEFERLNPKWIDVPIVDWFSGEQEIISLTIRSEVEFKTTVRDYYYIKSPNYMDLTCFETKIPKEFPCNIILVSGCEWVDIFGGKEDLKEALQKTIEQIG